jgi:type II secretory pathway pseudopilin PulG
VIDISRERRAAAGFSLVEMAIVTLLVGILLTMGLAALKATRDASAASQTQTKQNAIKDALIAYIRRNNRLPCADIDFGAPDGIENRATAGDPTTACATAPTNARFGILPYVTLGLARDAAVDGWGNFFSYHVSNAVTSAAFNPGTAVYTTPITNANTDWTLSANLRSGSTGELTVNTRDAAGTLATLTTSAVAVVVSHGPNGLGAYTVSGTRNTLPSNLADEYLNTYAGGGTTYVTRTPTTSDAATGGAFDDYVLVLSADDLLGPLFKDGTLKSPAGQLADTFAKIENAIGGWAAGSVGYASYSNSSCTTSGGSPRCRVIPCVDYYNGDSFLNNCSTDGGVPYGNVGLSVGDVMDPWGRPIRYTINTGISIAGAGSGGTGYGVGIGSSSPAGGNTAYTLESFGPDRNPGGGDDLTVTVTVTDLRAGLTGLLP